MKSSVRVTHLYIHKQRLLLPRAAKTKQNAKFGLYGERCLSRMTDSVGGEPSNASVHCNSFTPGSQWLHIGLSKVREQVRVKLALWKIRTEHTHTHKNTERTTRKYIEVTNWLYKICDNFRDYVRNIDCNADRTVISWCFALCGQLTISGVTQWLEDAILL